jgi:hypothetical protein
MFTRLRQHQHCHCPNGRCANRAIARINPLAPRWWLLAGLLILSLTAASSRAAQINTDEPYNTGWSFQIDNDLLASGDRDQDYTGGFLVTLSGRRAAEYPATPERIRSWLDHLIGIDRLIGQRPHRTLHALEWGAALFTPVDIESPSVNTQDRPYASLFFLNSTEQHILPSHKLSIKSGLTVGILGLELAGKLQSEIHSAIGNSKPRGWNHQISSGGELTLKYSVGFQRALHQRAYPNGLAQELNWTGKLDLGFTTGAGVGFNWRFGRINTPWWSFNPHQSDYVNFGANIAPTSRATLRVRERYIYAGGNLNYNVYNAFVQGQFRHSDHTVDRDDIIPATAEFWVGASYEMKSNLRVDLFVRARTKELELRDSVPLAWGGLIFSRSF